MCLDAEGVVEFKAVHSKDHPDEVAESLSAYGGGRLVTGIEIIAVVSLRTFALGKLALLTVLLRET